MTGRGSQPAPALQSPGAWPPASRDHGAGAGEEAACWEGILQAPPRSPPSLQPRWPAFGCRFAPDVTDDRARQRPVSWPDPPPASAAARVRGRARPGRGWEGAAGRLFSQGARGAFMSAVTPRTAAQAKGQTNMGWAGAGPSSRELPRPARVAGGTVHTMERGSRRPALEGSGGSARLGLGALTPASAAAWVRAGRGPGWGEQTQGSAPRL